MSSNGIMRTVTEELLCKYRQVYNGKWHINLAADSCSSNQKYLDPSVDLITSLRIAMNYSEYHLKPKQRAPYKEAIIFKLIIPSLIQPYSMFRACTSSHVAIKHQRIDVSKDTTATERNGNPQRITDHSFEYFAVIPFLFLFCWNLEMYVSILSWSQLTYTQDGL